MNDFFHNSNLNTPDLSPQDFLARLQEQGVMYINGEEAPVIKLTVLGEPTAQKRHRSTRIGGFTRQYDPSASDKKDFLSIVQDNAPDKPFDQPLRVDCHFYFKRPKSHYKTGKNAHLLKDNPPVWHTARPDRDNLDKFVMDSMSKIYWRDDSVVCSGEIKKMYSDNPRTEISIYLL